MSFEAFTWGRTGVSLESRKKVWVGNEGRAWTQFECESVRRKKGDKERQDTT